MTKQSQRVVVLGASANEARYAFRALMLLQEHGHDVIPVNPAGGTINGLPVVTTLDKVTPPIDTLTVYVSSAISSKLADIIARLRPGRVIFNPGAENPDLQTRLATEHIPTLEACTLVLLNTGQF